MIRYKHGVRRREDMILRALQLLNLFDKRKWVTLVDIAEELHCGERTAKRWIRCMRLVLPMVDDRDDRIMHYQLLKR